LRFQIFINRQFFASAWGAKTREFLDDCRTLHDFSVKHPKQPVATKEFWLVNCKVLAVVSQNTMATYSMYPEEAKKCMDILTVLHTNHNCTPFAEPVPWQKFNLPSYAKVAPEVFLFLVLVNNKKTSKLERPFFSFFMHIIREVCAGSIQNFL